MAGKKKAKKVGRPAKKKVRTKSIDAVAKAVKSKFSKAELKTFESKLEVRHVYCVVSRYATKTLCEFTTLEAAQQMIEANKQINDLELCVVVMPGAEYRSTEW